MFGTWVLVLAAQATAGLPTTGMAETPIAVTPEGPIESILLYPIFRDPFDCGEHVAGDPAIAGDALGTDCQVMGGTKGKNRSFARAYRTDGAANEDWYSWGADVLAPVDGVVVGLLPNPKVNTPGTKGRPPAGLLQIRRADGVVIMLGHLTDFAVKMGDEVKAGQVIAKVGNNGPSYAPHVHVGASRGSTPLQIRWDQKAMGELAGN